MPVLDAAGQSRAHAVTPLTIVTGSSGFIGGHFARRLLSVIPVEQEGCWEWLESFDRWGEVGLIIHQGAISSTIERDIGLIHRYNVAFTLALFERAIEHGIPVQYASSASVYGNLQGVVNPLNFYAISKLQIDYWVQDNMHRFSRIQGFRYFNVYGDGEDHKGDQSSPVSKFRRQIQERGYLSLFEGSDQFLRDFVLVDNVVDLVLDNPLPSGIYDLGTSQPVSFAHVAQCVASRFGGNIREVPFPDHLKGRYQDYTCARSSWGNYKFQTIEEYLS